MRRKNTVFECILKYLPRNKFDEAVKKRNGDKWSKKFKYWDLFLVLLHGQISDDVSLRTLRVTHSVNRYFKDKVIPRSTLSDCCKKKDPEVLMEVFKELVKRLDHKKSIKELNPAIELLDSTSIMLMEKGHEWAKDNGRIKGLKVHTLYDHALKSPTHFSITSANVNDIEEAKKQIIKPKKMYVFDKGYCDFSWWNEINEANSYFVTRLKKGVCYEVKREIKVKNKNISCDKTIILSARNGKKYKHEMRYIEVKLKNKKPLILVTNDFENSAERIADLYKERWKIELFFKCIKQNLKIKKFWGKSENAIKLQIIVAMIAYVLMRLIQMSNLHTYSFREIRIILRANIGNSLGLNKIFKIPVSANSTRILKVPDFSGH